MLVQDGSLDADLRGQKRTSADKNVDLCERNANLSTSSYQCESSLIRENQWYRTPQRHSEGTFDADLRGQNRTSADSVFKPLNHMNALSTLRERYRP